MGFTTAEPQPKIEAVKCSTPEKRRTCIKNKIH
jgi:hypothetical protein